MGKSHNPDNKTKALGNQNPNILQANWPAGLTLGKSASVSQRDVTAQSTNAFLLISPEQNHIRRVTCTLSALGHTFLQTRHWISGLRLLLRTKSHRTAAGLPGPAAGCEFDPGGGASSFTESRSHRLYLGLLRLSGSISFRSPPGCCSKPADTHASEAGHRSPLPGSSPLSPRQRLPALKTGQ